MQLLVHLHLYPTAAQDVALRQTQEAANAAINHISAVAWTTHTFRYTPLQRLTYRAVRHEFGLAAQLTVRCLLTVLAAYQRDRTHRHTVLPHAPVRYDDRLLSVPVTAAWVSLWTVAGRQRLAFTCPADHRAWLPQHHWSTMDRATSVLLYTADQWSLLVPCVVPSEP